MKTPFDSLFDFDHDGELDGFEEAAATVTFLDFLDESEENAAEDTLLSTGIDLDDFDMMDDDEKREALEDADLDPSDFDLDF